MVQGSRGTGAGIFNVRDGDGIDPDRPQGNLAANTGLAHFTPTGIGEPECLNGLLFDTGIFEACQHGLTCEVLDAQVKVFAEPYGIDADNVNIAHVYHILPAISCDVSPMV